MLLREFRYLLGPQGTEAVASIPGTKQTQRAGVLPFKTAGHHLPWGKPLGMTILDTPGRDVSDGLKQKHAREP